MNGSKGQRSKMKHKHKKIYVCPYTEEDDDESKDAVSPLRSHRGSILEVVIKKDLQNEHAQRTGKYKSRRKVSPQAPSAFIRGSNSVIDDVVSSAFFIRTKNGKTIHWYLFLPTLLELICSRPLGRCRRQAGGREMFFLVQTYVVHFLTTFN